MNRNSKLGFNRRTEASEDGSPLTSARCRLLQLRRLGPDSGPPRANAIDATGTVNASFLRIKLTLRTAQKVFSYSIVTEIYWKDPVIRSTLNESF